MSEGTPGGGGELHARVGELRRLTIMFSDVVGSTELSREWEPEAYRDLMGTYRAACREVIESEFEGHILQIQGDGILAVFGFPVAHENDAERAVRAGLALVRAVDRLSLPDTNAGQPLATRGQPLAIRVAVHNGLLYVDLTEDEVYGLAANVGARLQTIAEPGTVVMSDEVRALVEDRFQIEPGDPQIVKGVPDPLQPFRVVAERRRPVSRSWATPLIGRDAELERLRQAWTEASSGAGGHVAGVLVSGEAGVGKSRLVAAFIDEASGDGARVVELQGSPFHTDAGFHPVRSLIEYRCAISDDADPVTRLEQLAGDVSSLGLDTSAALPLLAPVMGIAPSAGYEPVAAEGTRLEELIAEAARGYVLACTAGDRAVIVAEDLHWFDPATRALLATLAEDGPHGVLVIGASREGEEGQWEAIELRPLTQPARLELIDALQAELSEQDRLGLAARSGGIPLFLEELTRAGPDPAPSAGHVWGPAPGSVPAALYEPLVARLYVTASALPVAATAAAAGQEVDRSLLAAAVALPAKELDSTLQTLLDAHILKPASSRPDRYQFHHELLREVAYELQPASWRRKVHSRLGDVLTREEPGDWLVVASHFERAERYEEAARAYRETAEAARRRGALEEARSHLSRAIGLIQPLGADHAAFEIDLRLRRGFLGMTLEGAASTDAAADYERCLELAATDPFSDAMYSTLVAVWSYHLSRGELEEARKKVAPWRSVLYGSRSSLRPANVAGFGILDWFAGNFKSALDTLTTALEELAEVGDQGEIDRTWFVPIDLKALMHFYLGLARFMASDVTGADASIAESLSIADGMDFPQGPWGAAYTHWVGSWMWMESGRLDDAAAALEQLRSSSDLHGFAGWQMIGATHASAFEAFVALRSRDPDETVLTDRANALGGFIEFWKALELRVFLPFYMTTCGALLAASGDLDGARQRYEESLALGAQTGMRFYDAETTRRMAHLAPEPEVKIAALKDALSLAGAQAARPFELRIALDLHEALGEDARRPLELAMAAFPEGATTSELEQARSRMSARS